MAAIYFSIGYVQPFADMSTEALEDGVTIVRGDDQIVGLRLAEPRLVLRLSEICAKAGIDEDKVWPRLRADADVLVSSRAATWGGGGA
ncbi:MAG TPA: hypothetical protein PKE32_05155 [Miltoncostaeaceae bacterium]|nr:hypothetical protein [Miltoncostaeaceae bacterium]